MNQKTARYQRERLPIGLSPPPSSSKSFFFFFKEIRHQRNDPSPSKTEHQERLSRFWSRDSWDDLKAQTHRFCPLWPAALWMGGILSACSAASPPTLLSPSQSNPVQFLFPKSVILGRQRFLVSCNPELKSVNTYLGQFQWPRLVVFFAPKFKIVYHHFGREKKRKKMYVNLLKKIFQRDEIGHKVELL